MQVTINDIDRCPGLNHYHIDVTAGGKAVTLTLTKKDFDSITDDVDLVDRFLIRIRSHIQENNLTTFSQIKASLQGATFNI